MKSLFFVFPLLAASFPSAANEIGPAQVSPPAAAPAPAPAPAGASAADTRKDLVSDFAAALKEKPGEAGPKAAEAIFKYMTDTANAYVSADALKDKGDAQLSAMVKTWVEATNKDEKRLALAELYAIVGADEKGDFLKELNLDLKPWSGQIATAGGPGQLQGTKADKWSAAFLDNALDQADKIFKSRKFSSEYWVGRTIKDDNPVKVPDGPGKGGKLPNPIGPVADYVTLYEQGAEVVNLYQKGDKYSRTIAIKLNTKKDEKGNLTNEIRIYDITDPKTNPDNPDKWDIFSQGFPIDKGGTSTFQLDDRTPGKKKYTLTMKSTPDGDMTILFTRDGVQSTDPEQHQDGTQIKTTVNTLALLRAQQAVDHGAKVNIGGKDFFAIGAAGNGFGKICYFPAGVAGQIRDGVTDPDSLMPALVANVTQTTATGTKAIGKKPDLGLVDGKPFHLEYDATKKAWAVVEGVGDKPKDEEVKKPDPPKPDPANPALPPALDPTKLGYYALNKAATQGAPESVVTVYSITPEGEKWIKGSTYAPQGYAMRHQFLVISAKGWNDYIPFQPRSASDVTYTANDLPTKVIKSGDKYYLATFSDGGVLYLDTSKFVHTELYKGFPQLGAVAFVDKDKKELQNLADKAVLPDAMSQAGFTEKDAVEAVANLKQVKFDESAPYTITGSKGINLVITFNDKKSTQQFWPTLKAPESKDPNHAETQTGNAYDKDKELPYGPFDGIKDNQLVNDGTVSILKKSDSAALYVNDVPEAQATKEKPRRYYVMFGYVNHGDHDNKLRSKYIEIFSKGNTDIIQYPSVNVEVDGLLDHKSTLDLTASGINIKFLGEDGKTPAKGAYAVFATNAATNKDKKGNCLGPVVWWGMTKEEAQKACEKGP